jgi:hypothetical protein
MRKERVFYSGNGATKIIISDLAYFIKMGD